MRLLAALLLVPSAALGVAVGPLPAPDFADTEVTAHHRLEQPAQGLSGLDFRLDFAGTPSNNVEVAFGRDADADGALATNEVGAAFASLAAAPPGWLYDRNWDLMRLTARGVDVRDERFFADVRTAGFAMTLR